jgi:hypothetical protein
LPFMGSFNFGTQYIFFPLLYSLFPFSFKLSPFFSFPLSYPSHPPGANLQTIHPCNNKYILLKRSGIRQYLERDICNAKNRHKNPDLSVNLRNWIKILVVKFGNN